MNNAMNDLTRSIFKDTMKQMFDLRPVWRLILPIPFLWVAYFIFKDPEFTNDMPINIPDLFWPTSLASVIPYIMASTQNTLAPLLASIASIVFFFLGYSFVAVVLLILVLVGLIIGGPFRRI